ncbi:hypothetical protein SAY87_020019 [Trapa incisa]|uniref:Uncharacterized protein n=1 Tax=Trapa incisa TaxID=236973 RepID=A0AAN7Q3L6_9MYRT|nr:hypothetical protein SAY87_020019 [Trapa incisa]
MPSFHQVAWDPDIKGFRVHGMKPDPMVRRYLRIFLTSSFLSPALPSVTKEGEPVLPIAATAEDAAHSTNSSSYTDLASIGSPEGRESSELPLLSEADGRDQEKVPEYGWDSS